MTGKFIITREHLKELWACESGMEFYDATYPDGEAGYQDMLDQAVKAGHTDYATWLLSTVGQTEDVLEMEDISNRELDIVFAGQIIVKRGVVVRRLIAGRSINAGEGIEAILDINAGCGIKAGCGINAGEGIKAGEDYAVYAGLRVNLTDRDRRTVRAKERPENLMCGEFVPVWQKGAIPATDIGKTVFLTRAEAEAALAQSQMDTFGQTDEIEEG